MGTDENDHLNDVDSDVGDHDDEDDNDDDNDDNDDEDQAYLMD